MMINTILSASATLFLALNTSYKCGETRIVTRPYGSVELRVNCNHLKDYNLVVLSEFKGNVRHGIKIDFDSLWRPRDSCFFVDGKKEGTLIFWDTAGIPVGKESYRNDRKVGVQEYFWEPGRPSNIKHYNDSGLAHGIEQTWWKNGNKKTEFLYERGSIIRAAEFYPSGKLRYQHERPYEVPGSVGVFKSKLSQGETWAPNGKSTGKVKNGNGTLIRFSAQPDSLTGRYKAWHETYKDSLLYSGGKVDSAQIAKWLR